MTKRNFLLFCLSPTFYTNQRLIEECQNAGHQLIPLNPYLESLRLTSEYVGRKCDAVMLRTSGFQYDDYDLLVAQILGDQGAKVVNPVSAFNLVRDKNKQAYTLHCLAISTVETYTIKSLSDFPPDLRNQKLVVKTQRGLGGKGVFDMPDDLALENFIKKHAEMGDQRFIVQPLIDEKLEIRALIINDQLELLVEKNPRANNFKGNKEWSDCKLHSPLKNTLAQLSEMVEKLKSLKLNYYALDLFLKDNKLYVLELNLLPGLEVLEEVSGENLAQKIISHSLLEF